MLSLGFQQVLTMFPATVLVAILTKFDVGVTLLASGIGTIIALLVSGRRIPMYYGSSFSYITVVITVDEPVRARLLQRPAHSLLPRWRPPGAGGHHRHGAWWKSWSAC
ncbi:MAG: hypothetical protein M0C28_44005 [Candidatus Moduliflexus flocculans]|nr:hypothetical protein [Candidatus Moduliflexus flocculans]